MECETTRVQPDNNSEIQSSTTSCCSEEICLTKTCIGKVASRKTGAMEEVLKFTWTNANRMSVSVMTYGATVMSIRIPNRQGISDDVVLGFDSIEEYQRYEHFYIGSTIGRTANVIDGAEYELNSDKFVGLSINHLDRHHKDGGLIGFSRVNWVSYVKGTSVILTYTSSSDEEGYPGVVMAQIMYSITVDNSLCIAYSATSDRVTPVDLATRIVFNLTGHAAGAAALRRHFFHLNGIKCATFDNDGVPQKSWTPVGEMDWDCRIAKELGEVMIMQDLDTISLTVSIDHKAQKKSGRRNPKPLTFVARVICPDSGRVLEMYTTQSCVQFSTCHEFPEKIFEDELLYENFFEDEENELKFLDLEDEISCSAVMKELHDTIQRTKEKCINGKIDKDKAMPILNEIYTNLKLMEATEKEEDAHEEETEEETEEDADEESNLQDSAIKGKEDSLYNRNAGFYLQAQNFPDAIHRRKKHPDILLRPGQLYTHDIVYKFGLHLGIPID